MHAFRENEKEFHFNLYYYYFFSDTTKAPGVGEVHVLQHKKTDTTQYTDQHIV